MKIKYRFFKNFSLKEVSKLKNINICVDVGCDAFTFYENDEMNEQLQSIFGSNYKNYVSVVKTEFSENERINADYLSIESSKILGYPQPEDLDGNDELEKFPFNVFPYLKNVFEITKRSENFGIIRGKQIGSISLLSEPKWNKKGIGTIYWLEDTFFTTPSIYENIFKPLNIQSKSVIGYGNQKPLVTVVQLLPQGISSSKLNINDNNIDEKTLIPGWEMTRFHLNNKGFFPSFENHPGNFDFFVSQENFGSGHANYKEVFVSQKLYQLLKNNNIKGLDYYPVKK